MADAFSCLPRIKGKTAPLEIEENEHNSEAHFSLLDDPESCECFVNFLEDNTLRNPLDLAWPQQHQVEDLESAKLHLRAQHTCPMKNVNVKSLMCC